MNEFTSHFYYHSHDVTDSASYTALNEIISDLDEHYEPGGNRIFYLAMAPEFFGTIAIHLKEDGLTNVEGLNVLSLKNLLDMT